VTTVDPRRKVKSKDEREQLLFDRARGEHFAGLDDQYAQLDYMYDRAKADLDRQWSESERRANLLEQGRAQLSGQAMADANDQVATAKAREAELKAKAAGRPPPPTETLDDVYQPVNAGASSPNPTQIPVTAIGPGGPQGVMQAQAGGGAGDEGIPPWLVSGRTQTDTGTRDFGAGVFMPDSSVRSTVDVQQNAPTADAAMRARALMERAQYTSGVAESRLRAERVGQMLAAGQGDPRVAALGVAMLQSLPPEEQQMAMEFAGSFQGKEATGTARVRLQGEGGKPSLVPGYMAPPGSVGFDDVPRTTNNLTVNNPGTPTMGMRTALQTEITEAGATADGLNASLSRFQPEYLTLRKRYVDVPVARLKEKITGRPDTDAGLEDFSAWAADTSNLLTKYISDTTGAVFSVPEGERLGKRIPKIDDSVSEYLGKTKSLVEELELGVIRNALFLHEGFGDPAITRILDSTHMQVRPDGTVDVAGAKSRIPLNRAYLHGKLNEAVAMRQRQFEAQGMSPEDAARAADAWANSPEGFNLGSVPRVPRALEDYQP
jgi:hypothetical protein